MRAWILPGLIRAGSWGVIDQAIISGTNFLSMIVAARLLGPTTFVILQKSMLTKALQALRNTRAIIAGTITGATAGSFLGGALVIAFGLPAAGSIMLLSTGISASWLAWVWARHLRSSSTWPRHVGNEPHSVMNP